jgi:hypothetical protein
VDVVSGDSPIIDETYRNVHEMKKRSDKRKRSIVRNEEGNEAG